MLQSLGEDEVAMLRTMVETELGVDSGLPAWEDPVDLFQEYLTGRPARTDDDEAAFLEELVTVMSTVRVNANGGDRQAHEKIQAIGALLDRAIENDALPAWDIVLTGKILVDAGWVVPDRLKQAMASAMQHPPPDMQDVAGENVFSSLADLAERAGQNPFDIHEHLNSFLATFPQEAGIAFLFTLAASGKPAILQSLAGFVLNADEALAGAAADALAEAAGHAPVEASQIDRLVRLRPWLPPARQGPVDHAIRSMRLNALPPVAVQPPAIVKCYASVCDATGTRSLFATQRAGAHYQLATVMIKISGVAEAMIVPDLPKSTIDSIVREMKASVPVTETDVAGLARMLELALADNLASRTLPPFKLVDLAETLGLGQLHPDSATPMDILASLLSDLPPEQTDAAAAARAHVQVLDSDFADQWFEASEAVDDLLSRVGGFRQRVHKMMHDWLPGRRQFWARQCALSALAMRGNGRQHNSAWKPLALVGRDIVSDMPLDRIPLMKRIAEVSVEEFQRGT
jgi:hypothetical protein